MSINIKITEQERDKLVRQIVKSAVTYNKTRRGRKRELTDNNNFSDDIPLKYRGHNDDTVRQLKTFEWAYF